MAIFTQQCQFPGTQPLKDATGGWDVVYALKFSGLNEDLKQRKPWAKFNFDGTVGRFRVTAGARDLTGTISKIAVVPGADSGNLRFELTIDDAFLSFPPTPSQPRRFVAKFDLEASVIAGTESGLLHVSFAQLNPQNLTIAPPIPEYSTNASIASTNARNCLLAFLSAGGEGADLLSDALATIYTKDYAENVNMPWLMPSTFHCATADLPQHGPDEGVLAVLGKIGSDVSRLAISVDPDAIPLDADVTAAILISPNVLAQDTYYKALNESLAGTTFANFVYDADAFSVTNQNEIRAYYAVDEDTGQSAFVTEEGLATAKGRVFPLSIPANQLRMKFTDGSLTVELISARIDIQNSSYVELSISQDLELVVLDDGNIDLSPVGIPTQSARTYTGAGDSEAKASTSSLGAQIFTTILLECLLGAVDHLWLKWSHVAESDVNTFSMDVVAAYKQAAQENTPVDVEIGSGRLLRITTEQWKNAGEKAKPFNKAKYRGLTELKPKLEPLGDEEMASMDTTQGHLIGRYQDDDDVGLLGGKKYERHRQISQLIFNAVQGFSREQFAAFQKSADDALKPKINSSGTVAPSEDAALKFKRQLNAIKRAADLHPNQDRLSSVPVSDWYDSDMCAVYEALSKYIESQRSKGMIGDVDYMRILRNSPKLLKGVQDSADPTGNVVNPQIVRFFGRDRPLLSGSLVIEPMNAWPGGPEAGNPITHGIIRDYNLAIHGIELHGNTSTEGHAIPLLREIIRKQPAPIYVKFCALALYVGGLAAGIFFPTQFTSPTKPEANEDTKKDQHLAGGYGKTKIGSDVTKDHALALTTRLFGAVEFPFMRKYDDSALQPEAVLKRAAVNGGLVLGVSVEYVGQ